MSFSGSSSSSSEMVDMEIRSNYSESSEEEEEEIDSHVQNLLTEKLLQGMVLQQNTCPNCDGVPLLKPMMETPEPDEIDETNLSRPVEPVKGVPFCVSCNSHVITENNESSILSKFDSIDRLKKRGSILFLCNDVADDGVEPVKSAHSESSASSTQDSTSTGSHSRGSRSSGSHSSASSARSTETPPKPTEDEVCEEGLERPLTDDAPEVLAVPSVETEEESGVELIQQPAPEEEPEAEPTEELDPSEELIAEDFGSDFDNRRDIATKVLGQKMIKGWTLRETQCDKCEMPLMFNPNSGDVECVVCEALIKRAEKRKKNRLIRVEEARVKAEAKAKLEEKVEKKVEELREWENQRLAEELKMAKMSLEEAERQRIEERAIIEENTKNKVLKEQEQLLLEKELRMTREAREREEERNRREEQMALERHEESRKLAQELQVAREEAERERKAREEKDKEKSLIEEELKKAKEAMGEAENKAKDMEDRLAKERKDYRDETRAAEEMRHRAEMQVNAALEARREAELNALAAKRAIERAEREKRRLHEQSELRELAREAEDARYEADMKAMAAQQILIDAENRAKEASRQQYDAEERLDRESLLIEEQLQRERFRLQKDFKHGFGSLESPDDTFGGMQKRFGMNQSLSSHSSSNDEWELRRERSRQIISNRILGGWEMLPEYCLGKDCNYSPLLCRGDIVQCVVCDGSGTGEDGAYATTEYEGMGEKSFMKSDGMTRGNEVDFDNDDDISISSRQSVTIDIPENFDPTNPEAMAQLVTNAARSVASMGSRRSRRSSSRSRAPRGYSPSPRSRRSPSPSYNSVSRRQTPRRSSSRGGFRGTPPSGMKRTENQLPFLPPRPKPSPESRNPGGMYRGGAPRSPSSASPEPRRSMVIAAHNEDETSQITEDDHSLRSSASQTLNAILHKIEDCKAQLNEPSQDASSKAEAAKLIEKLADAAVAVQRLESPL